MMFYSIFGVFALTGVWLVYAATCELFNTTTILIKSGKLTFWTSPISFQGVQSVDVAEIGNLSLERLKITMHSKDRPSKSTFKHFVHLNLKNGQELRLCRAQDLNEGMYIERLIEQHLNLEDQQRLDRVAF